MRMKEMCERFKRFLFPSPVLEDDSICEEIEVKKCKYCGSQIKDSRKDFCSDSCEFLFLDEKYREQEYGRANCVVCGKEFVKRSSGNDICSSECNIKKQISELKTKIKEQTRIKEREETIINNYVVTPEAFDIAVDAEMENAKKSEVKKCKYCGLLLNDNQKDFCNNYCESMYRVDERFKKKYGVAKCVMCGKEFVKHSSTQKTCSGLCEIKRREIWDLEARIADEENYFDDTAPETYDDACSEVAMQNDDNSDSVELEENLSSECEDYNCTAQCDCVLKDTRSEETQENLTEIPQESKIKCAFCGDLIGRLNTGINGEYCFCSEKCFKYFSHYGKSRYYGVEKCSRCGKEFFKHYKNQKQCYDCGHKSRYF